MDSSLNSLGESSGCSEALDGFLARLAVSRRSELALWIMALGVQVLRVL